jgi:alpha-glucosidase
MSFLGKIPTVWDETIIIEAKLGKYIVEARRKGDNWYLAAMNDWTPVEFSIPLDFLKDGIYNVITASDGINAKRNPQDYKLIKTDKRLSDTLKLKLAPGGGFAASFIKK